MSNGSSLVSELGIIIENNVVTHASVCMNMQPMYTLACRGIPFPVFLLDEYFLFLEDTALYQRKKLGSRV